MQFYLTGYTSSTRKVEYSTRISLNCVFGKSNYSNYKYSSAHSYTVLLFSYRVETKLRIDPTFSYTEFRLTVTRIDWTLSHRVETKMRTDLTFETNLRIALTFSYRVKTNLRIYLTFSNRVETTHRGLI